MAISRFFWGSSQDKASPHMKSWDFICRPKECGGLGIRKMAEFNDALLGRQAWRIVSRRDSLLSLVFFAKYCKDDKNLKFACFPSASPLARPICKKINSIITQCSWRIGNGRKTHLGSTLWITPDKDFGTNVMVSDMTDGRGNWVEDRVKQYYNEPKVTAILDTPLSMTGVEDCIS